jgi:hypothetical protein
MNVELRGRDNTWKVYYPNELRLASPVPSYDREGVLKETLLCGSDGEGFTEAHFVGRLEDARAYAEYLCPGADITVVRKLTPQQAPATG